MAARDINARSLLGSSSLIFGSGSVVALISLAQGIIIARGLGPSTYGIWAVVLSYSLLVQSFIGFRTTDPLTKHLVETKRSGETNSIGCLFLTTIITDLLTNCLGFAVIFLTAPWVAEHIAGGEESVFLYRLIGATLLFSFLDSSWLCIARDGRRFRLLSALPIFVALAKLAGVVLLMWLEHLSLFTLGYVYLAVALSRWGFLILSSLSLTKSQYALAWRTINFKMLCSFQTQLKPFWHFMFVTYAASLLSALVKQGDALILGLYCSDKEVGIYRLATTVAQAGYSVASALSQVAYQDLNELAVNRDFNRIRNYLKETMAIWVPCVIAGVVAGMLLSKPLILNLFGAQFANSSPICVILILGYAIPVMFFWSHPMVLALGRYRLAYTASTVVNLLYLLSAFFFVPHYQAVGMAIVTAATWSAGYSVSVWIALSTLRGNNTP